MTTKSTYRLRGAEVDRRWHVVDAKERPLGRVATEAARLLQGKHKATFEPHLAMGDFVVVVNAKQVDLTGKKREQKVYYRHTGYPGGLRSRTYRELLDTKPEEVVRRSVRGMLPKGPLGRKQLKKLKVYAGPAHPHTAQQPKPLAIEQARRAAS